MKIVPLPSSKSLKNVVYAADEVLNQTADVFIRDVNKFIQLNGKTNFKNQQWYDAFKSYAACIAGFLKLKSTDDFTSTEDWTLQDILEIKLLHKYGLHWFYDISVSHYIIEYADASQLNIASSKI